MPHQFELNDRAEFLDCSEKCAQLFGITRGCIAKHRLDEFVAQESGTIFLTALLDAYRGNTVKNIPILINGMNGHQTTVLMGFATIIDPESERITKLIGRFKIYSGKGKTIY
ncbi:hypothetical protein HZC53_02640 [Candidatus Uhrbacteria bacterium]|nr:hypothetical protein [Candidatus Uhrbacteria bacterium]